MKLNPVRITAHWYKRWFSSSNSGGDQRSDICLLNNLVNALAAQIKRIRNLPQRHSLAAQLKNFRISGMISGRPWTKWSPRPSVDGVKFSNTICINQVLLAALPYVSDPSPEVHLTAVDNFDMNCRDFRVALALSKLINRIYIKTESGVVIHARTLYHLLRRCANTRQRVLWSYQNA